MLVHDKNSETTKSSGQFSKGRTVFSRNYVRATKITRTDRKPKPIKQKKIE